MEEPDFIYTWTPFLADLLYINRIGARFNDSCSQDGLLFGLSSQGGEPTPMLAQYIRDHAALDAPYDAEWTIRDVLMSSLALDDLSPAFRAQLFARQASRLIDFYKDSSELAWRRIYAVLFARTYLGRRLECLTCHNSEWSVTDNPDPALDRFFPLPGHVERSLFGSSAGRAFTDLDAFFRLGGSFAVNFLPEGPVSFYEYGAGVSPWGMAARCGQFIHPMDVEPDPLNMRAYLGADLGDRTTVFDLEAILRAGFDGLRGQPTLPVGPDGSVSPELAMVWMLASHVSDEVWRRITGSSLTAHHDFPRTQEQQQVLLEMTERFIQSGYSLRELIVFTVMHPTFNAATPSDCALEPHVFRKLFNPWIVDDEDPTREINSAGELVVRAPSRSLVSAAAYAMDWRLERNGWGGVDFNSSSFNDPDFLADFESNFYAMTIAGRQFEIDHGAFVMDGETGFRGANFRESLAWEERFGACEDPSYDSVFGERNDYIDTMLIEHSAASFLDLALSLKDRLLGAPVLDAEEQAWLEAVAGNSFDDLSESSVEEKDQALRRLCAVWLASPQFQLDGLPNETVEAEPPLNGPGTDRSSLCAYYENKFGIACPQ
jgi:hypothetical protein